MIIGGPPSTGTLNVWRQPSYLMRRAGCDRCADWLAHLDADSYPPAVSLRPSAGRRTGAVVAAGPARVAAVIDRIAADVDELARARRAQGLSSAAVLPERVAGVSRPRATVRTKAVQENWTP